MARPSKQERREKRKKSNNAEKPKGPQAPKQGNPAWDRFVDAALHYTVNTVGMVVVLALIMGALWLANGRPSLSGSGSGSGSYREDKVGDIMREASREASRAAAEWEAKGATQAKLDEAAMDRYDQGKPPYDFDESDRIRKLSEARKERQRINEAMFPRPKYVMPDQILRPKPSGSGGSFHDSPPSP